ncbi:small ribosomal subunit protein eS12-like [Saccopteryx leptura]|uniref:small ribosomal subunit protein eS12-like n=1 Tax=Saccopteryx leptura TaxID=249018 RepID=UPI00339CCD09
MAEAVAEGGIAAGSVVDVSHHCFTGGADDPASSMAWRGIHGAAKALAKRQAHPLGVLTSSCDEPVYVTLVEALCAGLQIDLIKVENNKKLGEGVGLCEIDREGRTCGVAVEKAWTC